MQYLHSGESAAKSVCKVRRFGIKTERTVEVSNFERFNLILMSQASWMVVNDNGNVKSKQALGRIDCASATLTNVEVQKEAE